MTTLHQGDRGPAVRELQLLLLMTGHDPGPLDGVLGPRTQVAASEFLVRVYGDDMGDTDIDERAVDALRVLPRRAVEVPRILTPITAVDMRIALCAGYSSVFIDDREPAGVNGLAIRVALAQLCVEHGNIPWMGRNIDKNLPPEWLCPKPGEATYLYVWNFNIGNRQVRREDLAGRGPLAPYFPMSPVEGSGASAHRATSAHYAYPNAAEGAAAYWRFLRDHCGPALEAFEAGDPARAAHELKVGAWRYSGDEAEYTRAMVDRFKAMG